MLQAGVDLDIIHSIDEELGLRELRAKVIDKARVKDEDVSSRFSIQRDTCYHPKSVEVMRKYLDSGVLSEYVFNYFEKGDRCWTGEDYRRYCVLVACAMTLGCAISDRVRETMKKMMQPAYLKNVDPKWALKPLAKIQLNKALAEHKDGVPYDFGNTTQLEASVTRMLPGTTTIRDVGPFKLVEVTLKNGKVIPNVMGSPTDEEAGLTPIHTNHLCASCGASETKDGGGELLACGRCHDRKYCSKECQKRHWKMHKIICTRPADQMAKFMQSIEPLDFGGKEEMLEIMGGKKPLFM